MVIYGDQFLLQHWTSQEIIWMNLIIKFQIQKELKRTSRKNFYAVKSLVWNHILRGKPLYLRSVLMVKKVFLSLHWFCFQHPLSLPPGAMCWSTKYILSGLRLLGKMWILKFATCSEANSQKTLAKQLHMWEKNSFFCLFLLFQIPDWPLTWSMTGAFE